LIAGKFMNKNFVLLTVGIFLIVHVMYSSENIRTEYFEFEYNGNKLTGFLDLPEGRAASAIVILVPGYGRTNFSEHNGYYDSLRSNFTHLGLACCEWDKAGCGKSEGTFDIDQPVQSSAKEVIAAIKELKHRNISGFNKIGLWGISRAGWICPLVIEDYPSIAFWISVSGTDDKENYGYLLESNLRIEGRSESEAKLLVSEWKSGNEVFRNGGSFEEYIKAIHNIRKDSFCISFCGYGKENKEDYLKSQKKYINEQHHDVYDKETGLMIYVPNFKETLNRIQCPVLAIFGEKDCNVDWRKTIALYKETIGTNKNASLTIKSFPDGNHSIIKCKTGGVNEKLEKWEPCGGYYKTMILWLKKNGFGK
jgi:pimeloyl-ACP methyl ester carboxylesterase